MIALHPLTVAHARALMPQPAQDDLSEDERLGLIEAHAAAGPCAALVAPDGTVLCVGGVVLDPAWPHRGVVWSLVSAHAGPHMLNLTRAVRAWLDQVPVRRFELYVDAQFPQGARWARLLGFQLETPEPMRHFLPNGNGAYMFGRV